MCRRQSVCRFDPKSQADNFACSKPKPAALFTIAIAAPQLLSLLRVAVWPLAALSHGGTRTPDNPRPAEVTPRTLCDSCLFDVAAFSLRGP
jgi:hypothetical protein